MEECDGLGFCRSALASLLAQVTPRRPAGSIYGKAFPTTPGTLGTTYDADGKKVGGSSSRSCTGGPGADNHCGWSGDGSDETQLGTMDCCETRIVPGGSYNRFNSSDYPATVSSFALDTFLVTAGRIRAWVDSVDGNLASIAPPEGAGANPHIPNSGWRGEWNRFLPTNRADVDRMLGPEYDTDGFLACQYGTDIDQQGALTWWTNDLDQSVKSRNVGNDDVLAANTQEALDRKPINCIPWHLLFAFCAWDGSRLPTDAEFQFAGAGGNEQRQFPWGSMDQSDVASINGLPVYSLVPIFDPGKKYVAARLWDSTINDGSNTYEDNYGLTWGDHVFGDADNASHVMPVGRRPAGNGKWGHTDLGGNMLEWMLDEGPIQPGRCDDCANVNFPAPADFDPHAADDHQGTDDPFINRTVGGEDWFRGGARAIGGGAWDNAIFIANGETSTEIPYYTSYPVLRTYRSLGGRCARDVP